ncbi:hypothetical protein ALC56_00866, partial [Trachymyrmex septentrionalis]
IIQANKANEIQSLYRIRMTRKPHSRYRSIGNRSTRRRSCSPPIALSSFRVVRASLRCREVGPAGSLRPILATDPPTLAPVRPFLRHRAHIHTYTYSQ